MGEILGLEHVHLAMPTGQEDGARAFYGGVLGKGYPHAAFVAKLSRLANAIEKGERFAIQVAGERVFVPAGAIFDIEHERTSKEEEIEFQIRWSRR